MGRLLERIEQPTARRAGCEQMIKLGRNDMLEARPVFARQVGLLGRQQSGADGRRCAKIVACTPPVQHF